jgi:hypothetical protein
MIHIVTDEDLLTLVVDRRDAEIEEIIAAVRSALSDDIFCVPAEVVAA